MKTVADQFAERLAAAGVKRIYGIVGDSLNGLTDAIRRQGKIEGSCAARGGRGLCGRCGGAPDRRACGLRRKLSTWQSAPHQRAVRLSEVARASACHCGADPIG